jgi:putative flippase GtrA
MQLAVLYGFFGLLSMLVNLVVQWVSVRALVGPYAVESSILSGTMAGLPVKYWLDRQFIFKSQDRARRTGVEFVLYASTGVATTFIFWGTEWFFHLLYGSEAMRLFGGALGLSIGFWVKYHLDKRFVFPSLKPGV